MAGTAPPRAGGRPRRFDAAAAAAPAAFVHRVGALVAVEEASVAAIGHLPSAAREEVDAADGMHVLVDPASAAGLEADVAKLGHVGPVQPPLATGDLRLVETGLRPTWLLAGGLPWLAHDAA